MSTTDPKPTLYHDSVDDLRRELIESHLHHVALTEKYFAATIRPDVPPTREAITDARNASAAAYNLAYTLAAVLGFAGWRFGPDVAHELACVADNVMTNGDDGDTPHNADVMPVPVAATTEEGR